MNEELKIIIKAEIADLKKNLDEAKSEIESVSKKSQALEKIGDAFKTVGKMAGTVAVAGIATATTAVAGLTKASLEGYAQYEQLVGGVETLFKSSAPIVKQYASNAFKTAGMSANQYMETVTSFSASLLQSVGGDTVKASQIADMAITDMSDNANKMGSTMESIQNAYQGFAKQNYTMLDNLKLGYGGTKEEMERLLADAEKISGIHYDISNLDDVYQAIHVVQTELGITGTTAEEASKTIEGSTKMMKASWDNLVVGLADDNADLEKLISDFVESVGTVAQNILPRVEVALNGIVQLISNLVPQIASVIPEITASILPMVIEAIINITNAIVEALPAMVEAVMGVVPMLIEGVFTIGESVIGAVFQIITSICSSLSENMNQIVNAVVTGLLSIVQSIIAQLPTFLSAFLQLLLSFVTAVAQALPQIINALPEIIAGIVGFFIGAIPEIIETGVQLLISLVTALPDIIASIVAVLPNIIIAVVAELISHIPEIVQCGVDVLTALVQALPTIISKIISVLPQIITNIVTTLLNNIPKIVQAGVQLLVSLVKNLPQIISTIVSAIPQIISSIVSAVGQGVSQMAQAGLQLIQGLFNGISNATSWLYGKISGWVSSVLSYIKGLFGIHSPSKVFAEYGDYLIQGLGLGIERSDYAVDALEDTAREMENAFNPVLDIPEVADADVLGGITSGLSVEATIDTRLSWMDEFVDRLLERENVPVVLQVDGKTFGEVSVSSINRLTRQTGSLGLVLA